LKNLLQWKLIVLGAFNSVPYSEFGNKYYGNGEIVLFSFQDNTSIHAYHWSKLNDFFIRSNDSFICYGGDDLGRSALIIDGELLTGSTNICSTFAMDRPLIDKVAEQKSFAGCANGGVGLLTKSESQMNIFSDVEFEIYALE